MKPHTFDIVISGAGPVGSALALMLARRAAEPQRIAVVGRALSTNSAAAQQGRPDPRTLALNHGSRSLLEQLGAWPVAAADITTVHVSQRGRLGRTLIQQEELGVPRLGSVATYDDVLASLHRALARSGVTVLDEAEPTGAQPEAANPRAEGTDPHGVTLPIAGGTIRAALRVRSDGARPRGLTRSYGQHALLTLARASRPRPGWAYERFTRHGPLALLPHPAGEGIYGIVWCNTPPEAERLQACSQAQFNTELGCTFGERLGRLEILADRHVFPLQLHAGPSQLDARSVAIGNAAQTLHPVAGQGLNLGLRDAAQLALALAPWLAQPDTDPSPALAAFARLRRPDRWLTAAVTDFLPRVFATGNPLAEHAAGLALLGLDLASPLRIPLARHLLQGLRR
ncbi:monooxygenase [Allopusillimonas soli]|uniref:FAD-dependent monooxygenase n=1 Tax=Allopusillimonas soli TaxID=659016 RepID=A0A853F569_9BURK|nr:FAD-dependent monooxygenase [Allopusillimonas soli]NYT35645.1 FAD-dependent monooxygenase [Allopusillimonas soli]TEA76039.1 monooxygenase [Allopusillimonas soli]